MNQINKPVIEVEDFSKKYGEFTAVRNLSFAVQPGEIVGLVGANGAGKTTTLRAITGILRPSAGTVRIVGFDIEREPVAAKQQFAYVPDTIHPYDLLTVTEHLHFVALAYRVANAEAKYAALLEELELADKKDEIASSLSLNFYSPAHSPSVTLFCIASCRITFLRSARAWRSSRCSCRT